MMTLCESLTFGNTFSHGKQRYLQCAHLPAFVDSINFEWILILEYWVDSCYSIFSVQQKSLDEGTHSSLLLQRFWLSMRYMWLYFAENLAIVLNCSLFYIYYLKWYGLDSFWHSFKSLADVGAESLVEADMSIPCLWLCPKSSINLDMTFDLQIE